MLLNLLLALLGAAGLTFSFPFSTRALDLTFLGLPDYEIPQLPVGGEYFQVAWLGFIALLPLLVLAKRCSPRATFGWGYLSGLLWLLASWGWLTSFGVIPLILLAIFFALPVGLFCYLAHWAIGTRRAAYVAWLLPAAWTAIEYLRSFGFWAFPWNLLGYSQARNLPLIQNAEWGGVFAVTFFSALANCALFLLLARLEGRGSRGPGARITSRPPDGLQPELWDPDSLGTPEPNPQGQFLRQQRLGHALAGLGLVLLAHAYGAVRLWQLDAHPAPQAIRVCLVQGGLSTREAWSDALFRRALEAYLLPSQVALSSWESNRPRTVAPPAAAVPPAAARGEVSLIPRDEWQPPVSSRIHPDWRLTSPGGASHVGPTAPAQAPAGIAPNASLIPKPRADHQHPAFLLVWPESCLPRRVNQPLSNSVPPEVQGLLYGHQSCGLLYGAAGYAHDLKRYENGGILLTDAGDTKWVHSKVRLVPYGEVVPFREAVRFLEYPWGEGDLSEGRSLQPFTYAGHKLGTMVCFDNVFGFLPRQEVRHGAEALLLITNNSWYDLASGVRQHCDMDVLRAVELRRAVGRSATTGWSHLVLPSGRVAVTSEHGPQAAVQEWLPLSSALSPYAWAGDAFAIVCLIVSAVLLTRILIVGKSEQFL